MRRIRWGLNANGRCVREIVVLFELAVLSWLKVGFKCFALFAGD